jgi:hypothetical protein
MLIVEDEQSGFLNHFSAISGEEGPVSLKSIVQSVRENVRVNSKKSLLLRQVLKTISVGLKSIPEFKEVEGCIDKTSFAKTWSALQFVACIPSVAGERSIRYTFLT